jgi:hypothetical protein
MGRVMRRFCNDQGQWERVKLDRWPDVVNSKTPWRVVFIDRPATERSYVVKDGSRKLVQTDEVATVWGPNYVAMLERDGRLR